jgi:RNA recognition motif-containing protein
VNISTTYIFFIFLKGIDINASEDDIKQFFDNIAQPIELRYKFDENGERPGFAFVTFSNPNIASKAVV